MLFNGRSFEFQPLTSNDLRLASNFAWRDQSGSSFRVPNFIKIGDKKFFPFLLWFLKVKLCIPLFCSEYKLSYYEQDVRVVSILPGINIIIFAVLSKLCHLKDSSTMKFGYSEEGRVFMFENTPSVVKLAGIHLEKVNKVRNIAFNNYF